MSVDSIITNLQTKNLDSLKKTLLEHKLSFKEDGNICLIFSDEPTNINRHTVIDCETLECLYKLQPYVYNSYDVFNNVDFKNISVHKSYEGTMMNVFTYNKKFYVTTRRCIDASESMWNKDKSHLDMFHEITTKKNFNLDSLKENLCYHFIMLHHENEQLISYSELFNDEKYGELIYIGSTELKTFRDIDDENIKLRRPEKYDVNTVDNIISIITEMENNTFKEQSINHNSAGVVVKFPNVLLVLQPETYIKLKNLSPNKSNKFQAYLELYQKKMLPEFLEYYPKIKDDVFNIVRRGVFQIIRELKTLYFQTRANHNESIYNLLGMNYKKVLYIIHGKYLTTRKNITTNDILEVVRELEPTVFKHLFYERAYIISKLGEHTNGFPIDIKNKAALELFVRMYESYAKQLSIRSCS